MSIRVLWHRSLRSRFAAFGLVVLALILIAFTAALRVASSLGEIPAQMKLFADGRKQSYELQYLAASLPSEPGEARERRLAELRQAIASRGANLREVVARASGFEDPGLLAVAREQEVQWEQRLRPALEALGASSSPPMKERLLRLVQDDFEQSFAKASLQMESITARAARKLGQLPLLGWMVGGATVLILGLLALGLEGALRRLANLETAASRIAAGDTATALPTEGTDEIGVLTAAIETMRSSLNQAFQLERRALEHALEQKARTRAILDATADGIVTIDERGCIVDVNSAVGRIFGYEASELRGQNVSSLAPSPHREEHPAYLERYLRTGEARILDRERLVEGLRKDGSTVPLALRVRELQLGGARSFIGVVQDITDRKLAEEALRKSHRQLQGILDNTPAAVYAKDLQGRYLIWNRMMEALFHRRVDDVLGRTDAELWPPELAGAFVANDRKVLEMRAPLVIEEFAPHDDGLHTYLSTKFPLLDASGEIYAVCGISTDITGRKRNEASLLAREHYSATNARLAELALSGLELPDLLAAASKLISEALSIESCCVLELVPGGEAAKLACCSAWKTTPSVAPVVPLRPDCMLGLTLASCATLRSEDLRTETRFHTHPLQFGQGIVSAMTTPILAEQGAFGVLCAGSVRSRTFSEDESRFLEGVAATLAVAIRRKQAELALKKKDEQLRQSQKLEVVGKLASGVAHDFNNLLTVILGSAQFLMEARDEDDAVYCDAAAIAGAAERASALTAQLLAFSRRQVLQPKRLDLSAVVADTEKMLRRLLGEDLELSTRLAPGLGLVLADPGQLGQVLLNLSVNARDAMPAGGKLTLETSSVPQAEGARDPLPAGSYVLLTVTDTGCGMQPEVLARIFEPFFTTKEAGKGTGLGLATVQGIVEQCGGQLRLSSQPGQGTQFRIYLPRVGESAATSEAAARPPVALGGSETILLVEDDSSLRKLTRRVLESKGYTLLEAASGEQALSLLRGHESPVHLLLTDVVMPGLSGRQVAEQVLQARPSVSILYMSGYTEDAVLRHGIASNEAPLLQKPFTPDALVRAVRERLDLAGGKTPPS